MAHFYAIQVLTFWEPFTLIPFYRKQYNGKKKSNAYRLHINKLYSYKNSIMKKMDTMQDEMLRDEASAFFDPDLFEVDDESFETIE